MTVAFYAPLKPPDDPTPSGERTMARALIAALRSAGLSVEIAARLKTRDGVGDAEAQARLFARAAEEETRLIGASSAFRPTVWITYHNYYKAPDLLGPALSRRLGIPYLVIEASRSPKRRTGPWAAFAAAADLATLSADAVLYMTERDRPALADTRPPSQRLRRLRPFLEREELPAARRVGDDHALRLIAVAMLREGDKRASYEALAAALRRCACAWTLDIVGDGAAEAAIRSAFDFATERTRFHGRLSPESVDDALRDASLFVWPGVGEAFGLAYLEAQAVGLPVVAEDRPGVRDVVRAGGALTPVGDPAAFAAAIDALAQDRPRREALGAAGRDQVRADHLIGGARRTLIQVLAELGAGAQS